MRGALGLFIAVTFVLFVAGPALADRTRSMRNEDSCQPGVDLSVSGPCWNGATPNSDGTYTLPFTFNFNGHGYNQIGVSPQGYIWFGASDPGLTPTSNLSTFGTPVVAPFLTSGFTENYSTSDGSLSVEYGAESVDDPINGFTATPLILGANAVRINFGFPFDDGGENTYSIILVNLEGGAGSVIEVDYGRLTQGADAADNIVAGFTNADGDVADFLTLFNPSADIDLFNCSVAADTDPCGPDTPGPDSYVGDGFDVAIPGPFSTLTLHDRYLADPFAFPIEVDADGRALFRVAYDAIQSVPEPASWLLMLAGFPLVAWMARRARRRRSP